MRNVSLAGLAVLGSLVLPVLCGAEGVTGHLVSASFLASVALLLIRRSRRSHDPVRTYALALARGSAMHVHLTSVRVNAVHEICGSPHMTLTWRGARTVILDADGRALAELPRNGLDGGYTLTIPVAEADLARMLLADQGTGGRMSIYATTDITADSRANLLADGIELDQVEAEFASWSGSVPLRREPSPWRL